MEHLDGHDDQFETQEQEEVKKGLKEIADLKDNIPVKHEDHEHSHEDETQEKKDKLADDIMARATGCSELVKKRVEKLVGEVREKGLSVIMDLRIDYANLFDNFYDTNNEAIDDLKKHYPDWARQDFDDLYVALYGENTREQTYEEIQEIKREVEESRKKYDEWLVGKKAEDTRREEEAKKQEEEYKRQRMEDFLAEEKEEAEKLAKGKREKRWFGLGRFFK